jgi:hypothetical protein
MKTSPLTDKEKECIREVIICDYRLSPVFHFFSIAYFLLYLLLISGTENLQK